MEENELMRAFRKMDANGDGYISHSELQRVLTSVSISYKTRELGQEIIS